MTDCGASSEFDRALDGRLVFSFDSRSYSNQIIIATCVGQNSLHSACSEGY